MLAKHYYDIYLIVVTILSIYCFSRYSRMTARQFECRKAEEPYSSLIVAALFTIFIGIRPLSGVFVDMVNYNEVYQVMARDHNYLAHMEGNYIFDPLYRYLAHNGYSFRWFIVTMSVLNLGTTWVALRKLFPRDTLLAYLVFLGAFSTFSYATNGLKAGVAAAFFLCALAYGRNLRICILLLIVSLGFHHSMLVCIIALGISWFIANPRLYFAGWFFCLLIALAHITYFQILLGNFSGEGGRGYLQDTQNTDWGGKTGFRWDFVLYSCFGVVIPYIAFFIRKIRSRFCAFISNTYLTINGAWMVCMYIPFTNRVAYLSWLMLPVVMIAPMLLRTNWGTNAHRDVVLVSSLSLLFTLATHYMYY